MRYLAENTCPVHNLTHEIVVTDDMVIEFCANPSCGAPITTLAGTVRVVTSYFGAEPPHETQTRSLYCCVECRGYDE